MIYIKTEYLKDKYLVTYGFHPNEDFSAAVGEALGKNPPSNTDIVYFRPKSITHDFRELSFAEGIERSYKGAKELRQYALKKYEKLPFIIELHDTPLYQTFFEKNPNVLYGLFYPKLNTKLGKVVGEFEKYNKNNRIVSIGDEMERSPGYHSATIEFWPTHFDKEKGSFYTLNIKEAENFSRRFMEYLKKKV